MPSKATTVKEYLAELAPDRRAAIEAVRAVIRDNIGEGYEEGIQYGMIGWYVPHRVYPAGYRCDPAKGLPFAALASHKGTMSLYLMSAYAGDGAEGTWFREEWKKSGKKLDMGKSCIRFRKVEDLALDVIGEAIRRVPVEKHIELYESATRAGKGRSAKQPARKAGPASVEPAAKKPAKTATTPAAKHARSSGR